VESSERTVLAEVGAFRRLHAPHSYLFNEVRLIPFDGLSSLVTAPIPMWGWIGTAGVLLFHLMAQARIGTTVGKWMLGLRTLRTTGHPCGLARSILHELLLCIDSLMLLCWIPGVINTVLTRRSQRLGDLAADTVVVLRPSVTGTGR